MSAVNTEQNAVDFVFQRKNTFVGSIITIGECVLCCLIFVFFYILKNNFMQIIK